MKSIHGFLAGVALSLALVPAAHAQATYGLGSCTGTNMINGRVITGTTQLFVGDPDPQKGGSLIPASFGGAVFNQAECQCKSRDISMHFILTSSAGPGSTPGTAMYIGQAGCEDPTMRAVAICDPISTTHPANNSTWSLPGASFQTIVPFDAIIPPEVVTNPKSATNYTECSTGGTQDYTVTVTVGPDTMSAVCTMPIVVNTQGPVAPDGVVATKGDGGLTVDWNVPSGTSGIDSYQVLCRKQSAPTLPAMDADFLQNTRYYFSSCINNHLYRRTIGGLNNGNDPATTTDIPIVTTGTAFPLDPRLRCSDRIMATTTQLETRLTGLTNGETYDVMVVAIDTFGNPTGSAVVSATPQANAGPLDDYCGGGACPGFGCQAGGRAPTAAGAGMAGLVGLGLLLLARARAEGGMSRIGKLLLLGVLGGLALSSPARAELQESPQHFAIELKFGPYVPHLDDAAWLNGKTPFSDHFGSQDDPAGARPHYGLLSQVEFDYQFWSKFGTLGIGLEGGYYAVSAPAFTVFSVTSGSTTTQQPCQITAGDGGSRLYTVPGSGAKHDYTSCISGDTDKFNVVPLALMLIYRFDVLDKRLHIPLIPYVKVGLAYYFWWFGNSNSFTAQYSPPGGGDKQNAAGGSFGVVIHPGLALDLSALDPRAARAIDQEIGLNRVSAFVELNAALVDGFHRDHVMNLSDTIVSAGLSFEF